MEELPIVVIALGVVIATLISVLVFLISHL